MEVVEEYSILHARMLVTSLLGVASIIFEATSDFSWILFFRRQPLSLLFRPCTTQDSCAVWCCYNALQWVTMI